MMHLSRHRKKWKAWMNTNTRDLFSWRICLDFIEKGFLQVGLNEPFLKKQVVELIIVYSNLESIHSVFHFCYHQKQPSRGVLKKRCFERAPIPKCDFNKATLQLYWNQTLLQIWCIFSEHIFSITPLDGCFCFCIIQRIIPVHFLFP